MLRGHPIGSVFAADGTLLHYFSGKVLWKWSYDFQFRFSENYGKTEYPSFGFFSEGLRALKFPV